MNEKTLEPESRYSKYDLDGDGVVTDEELEMDAKMMRMKIKKRMPKDIWHGLLFSVCYYILLWLFFPLLLDLTKLLQS